MHQKFQEVANMNRKKNTPHILHKEKRETV